MKVLSKHRLMCSVETWCVDVFIHSNYKSYPTFSWSFPLSIYHFILLFPFSFTSLPHLAFFPLSPFFPSPSFPPFSLFLFPITLKMRKLFFTDYSKGEMLKSANVYKDRLFVNAITSHAFKKPEIMMRVHQFYLEIAVKKSQEESERLQKELTKISKWTGRAKAFP